MEELLKIIPEIVAIIAGIFGAYKIFTERLSALTSLRKDEIALTKELISACTEKAHPLVIEKLFHALFRRLLDANEISILILEAKSPTSVLLQYIRAMKYVSIEGRRIVFKSAYLKKGFRLYLKWLYAIMYTLTAFIAIGPVLLTKSVLTLQTTQTTLIVLIFAIFGLLAFAFASEHSKIKIAERLVSEQFESNPAFNTDLGDAARPSAG